jgi:hypothetical protein
MIIVVVVDVVEKLGEYSREFAWSSMIRRRDDLDIILGHDAN